LPVGAPPATDVGLGSTSRSPSSVGSAGFDDTASVEVTVEVVSDSEVLIVANEYAGGGIELLVVLAIVEAPALVVLAVVVTAEEEAVTTSTPGHSDAMPMPNWKTPMILVSPTSTFAHTLLITSPMSCSPCTHAELHRFGGVKSLAWQPLMVVVYAARHWTLFWMSTRGVKLERETCADAPLMRSARPSARERIVVCIAGYLSVAFPMVEAYVWSSPISSRQ
jgi:hypothetical protein